MAMAGRGRGAGGRSGGGRGGGGRSGRGRFGRGDLPPVPPGFGGRGFGGPPFGDPGFGGPGFGGPGFGRSFRRGPRVRRGDVRAAALALLAEEPFNGYQIIQQIAERSGGVWRPSPGSVYPALQQLEDEGLIRSVERDGRRAFELTDAGRAHVEEHKDELTAPWEAVAGTVNDEVLELRDLGMQLFMAYMQVAQAGNEEQIAEARRVLVDARRSLYRILAESDHDETEEA
jgi:DNA-binding PadR family transcriptional regulator